MLNFFFPWKKKTPATEVKVLRNDELLPLAQLREEFDALWQRVLGTFERQLPGDGWSMHGGLEDRADEFVFRAELPGFESDEIDVQLSGKMLRVKAERKEEHSKSESGKEQQVTWTRYGAFERCLTLPHGVDENGVEASYHNGVLEVHLPKTEKAKGKRIAVKGN